MLTRRLLCLLLGVLLTAGAVCAAPPLVVGSKKFSESEVLAELGSILVEEKTGVAIERRMGLGGTILCFEALQTGKLDVYPEYTGTGLEILKETTAGDADTTYQHVRAEFRRRWHLLWLKPLGFNNTYALAMREDRAQALGIRTLSDLAAHQDALKFASSHEFLNRQDGWPGLAATYGFHNLSSIVGMEHGLLYEALQEGRIDVMDVYSTDGKIPAYHLRLLEDDRHLFPPYSACFVCREDALAAHPGVQAALESLSGQLDNAEMQRLNNEVEEQGMSVHSVALDFLVRHHLVAWRATEVRSRGNTFWDLMRNRRQETIRLVGQHIALTAAAVVLASIVGIPIGLAIARYRKAAEVVLAVVGVIQTIPSIALLAFMIPLLGLGVKPAIAALFLYALLPIVRNAYTGIVALDPNLIEAAQGLGLSPRQILRLVEMPLAMPMIMAGIRTSAVINIGTATLAAFIGAGGLGEPIFTGLTLNDPNLILAGAVPAALLAVVADFLLGLVEKWVAPRGVKR